MGWGSAVGAVLGSAFNKHSADQSWKRQKEYAQNAHQWEVEDLKKAGLNPMLSTNGGASLGSVASATDPGFASAGSAFDSNKTAKQLANAQSDNLKQQTETSKKQEAKLLSDIDLNNSAIAQRAILNQRQVQEMKQMADLHMENLKLARANTASVLADVENKRVANLKAKATESGWKRIKNYVDDFSDWESKDYNSARANREAFGNWTYKHYGFRLFD